MFYKICFSEFVFLSFGLVESEEMFYIIIVFVTKDFFTSSQCNLWDIIVTISFIIISGSSKFDFFFAN